MAAFSLLLKQRLRGEVLRIKKEQIWRLTPDFFEVLFKVNDGWCSLAGVNS